MGWSKIMFWEVVVEVILEVVVLLLCYEPDKVKIAQLNKEKELELIRIKWHNTKRYDRSSSTWTCKIQ